MSVPFEPVPLDHPWCPEDRPYPASYEAARAQDPTQCVATDPCVGPSTLWKITACEAEPVPTTTQVVVAQPPQVVRQQLPSTGVDQVSIGALATLFIVAGLIARRFAR